MSRYHIESATQTWFNAALCLFIDCGNSSVNVAWCCHCKDDFLRYLLMTVKPCAIGKITSFLVGLSYTIITVVLDLLKSLIF